MKVNPDGRFTGNVEVLARTEFERENIHVTLQDGTHPLEQFVAITMRTAQYGRTIVTYTRTHTAFAAENLPVGHRFVLSAKLTEQRDDTYGLHWKATRCKVGTFKTESPCDAKARRIAKMNKRLGLSS